MGLALVEAEEAAAAGDVPVGAVVLSAEGTLVAKGHNQREAGGDPTAHAEIIALRRAAVALGSWRLGGTSLVVTLEPCSMCAGALVAARVARVVFGTADPKGGACGSLYNLSCDPRLNHQIEVRDGILAAECARLLSDFFALRRNK